jgi:hypothetical protein
MLDRPVDAQSLDEYLRAVVIDRVQPSAEELSSAAKIMSDSSRLTIRDVHNLVLKHAHAIEQEESARSTKAAPFKFAAVGFLLRANVHQIDDD